MTEAEWLACTNPRLMVEFLRDKVSERKLRLFACACCRRIWHLLTDERSRKAVEVAEQYADEKANRDDLRSVLRFAQEAYESLPRGQQSSTAALVATYTARYATLINAPGTACTVTSYEDDRMLISKRWPEEAYQASMLRDIVGHFLFRMLPPVSPYLLKWNDNTIVKLAATIYDERAFDRLPILADALEDAGCDNADILAHCRSEGPHVRGCWVVDLILGKK